MFIGAERDSLKRLSIGGYEGGNGYIYCIVDTLNIPAESIILNMISSIIFEKKHITRGTFTLQKKGESREIMML